MKSNYSQPGSNTLKIASIEPQQIIEASIDDRTAGEKDCFDCSSPVLPNGRPEAIETDNSRPPRLSPLSLIIASVAIAIFAATGWWIYSATHKPSSAALAPAPVLTVTTVLANMEPVTETLVVTGTVSARDPLHIGAEVSGLRIVSVNAEEGDHVSKGQTLATLNSSLLEAQLRQAEARLHSAEANLKKAVRPLRPEEITALRAALAHAEATINQEEAKRSQARVNLTNAELNATRYFELARMGATSSQEAETKHVLLENAKEEITHCEARIKAAKFVAEQARERLKVAESGGRAEDIEISRATAEECQAQIVHLQAQLEQTRIKAPDAGVISKREAHLGNITESGKPLFDLIRQNQLELRASVSDIDLHRFSPGQHVAISATESGSEIQGRVRLVVPQVDPVTRMGTVRIDLPADKLHAGMFVRGVVKLGVMKAVTVPVETIVSANGTSRVFVLSNDSRAISRVVQTGSRNDSTIEVKHGLREGEQVILQGARFLADRDLVRVAK